MESTKSTLELETSIGVSGTSIYWKEYIRKLFDWMFIYREQTYM